mgnify:CR=1 FL=1
MTLDEAAIVAIARRHVEQNAWTQSVVRWDRTLRSAGDLVRVDRSQRSMPFAGYLVFIDLVPQANWGHPARSLLISADGAQVQAFDVQFPPYLDDYPEAYLTLALH